MRPLAAALLLALAAPVPAADKNEDKARTAAVAFLKAVKTKDVEAVLKASAVPFAYRENDKVVVLKDADALKKWLKERLDEIQGADRVPTELAAIHPFADLREKIKDAEQRKTIEAVVGKDGFIAVVSADGKMIPILVRIKDDGATVVGLGR